MTAILLDTHAWVWSLAGDHRDVVAEAEVRSPEVLRQQNAARRQFLRKIGCFGLRSESRLIALVFENDHEHMPNRMGVIRVRGNRGVAGKRCQRCQ